MDARPNTYAPVSEADSGVFDIARPGTDPQVAVAVNRIAAATHVGPVGIARDYASLALGPGRISFSDYLKLRLFDPAFYQGNDRRQVVGRRRNFSLVMTANYRHDLMGLFANKIALGSYLAAYGLRTAEIVAIYAPNAPARSPHLLRDVGALRTFLATAENYPLFCKPAEGLQSLGSMALKRYDDTGGRIESFDGRRLSADRVAAEIAQHYGEGYVFQRHLSPHAAIRALCGDRLATLRIVTMLTEDGPRVFRACWKIPAGANAADNYWRANNLLAGIDLATWRVTRVMSGTGLDLRFHTHHPDTGQSLVGIEVPNGEAVAQAALDGARLMRDMPLIGWDMALLDDGPIIIEANEKPDFFLNQLADGRGVLDSTFKAFLLRQKAKSAERARLIKQEGRAL